MKKEINLKLVVQPLLDWYDDHRRILPWREEATPYRVWVSEIMLQQTRVEAVKPYFERFVGALPTIEHLANLNEDALMKLWEGLGYYNRVRNMQKAARVIIEKYNGKMPGDYKQLLELPGIGSYTAGAIASIAFQIPVPAVDGNVLRVISRLTADESDIMKQSVRKDMENKLLQVMPQKRAGDFNQALMELGAMVCIPNGMAKCEMCPWYHYCEARKQGIVMELPKKQPKKKRKIEERTVVILQDRNKVMIQKRPSKGLLAGLYEFPNFLGSLSEEEVLNWVKEKGLLPIRIQKLEDSKHIFSHIEWHMKGFVVRIEEPQDMNFKGYLFVDPDQTKKEYSIPSAFAAYTKFSKYLF
ncbi:A/G-specific adenine glycosylase [Anaerosacchariphilus polymeriproducens]|uniref:Adenine DNA glycosylase n=1 Tax=Anaerosacchariphilus polymeriproducens TaxID=1812858 RepID=A0A371AWV2_9FIRM|nr:A/G-specific adenine glycosylase [Anaerosacchariphilus polymeriproducens]RDU24019.1 A/G-specific adenine glycosylase [Anaerosacchariphilus polymeriproducens]